MLISQRARRKGVAAFDAAVLQAVVKPAHPLRAAAVGKAVGHHTALALLLQRVVANFGGGVHGGFDVAVFQNLPRRLGVVRPNAGKAIGLQFQLDRQLVVLHLADAPALAVVLFGGGVEQLCLCGAG